MTEEILAYSLDIPRNEQEFFRKELARHSDHENENRILMKLGADGSYRPAVSSATESLIDKVRKLLNDTPEKLGQSPVQYLKTLRGKFQVGESYEATSYGDDFGVYRQLLIEPISMNQLRESLPILTKNLDSGSYSDGVLLVVLCVNSSEIDEARQIASTLLVSDQYQQVVLAIPKEPVQIFTLLREHQALSFLKNNEASLYGEGGELYEEWQVWDDDKSTQLTDIVDELFAPEKQMLDYFWQGQLQSILNNRQIKNLASTVMRHVFPDCPVIGEPKLTSDDFGGNWGYRSDCRDITVKLTGKEAAEKLWNETAARTRHIITQVFKSNGLLRKNQTGDIVIEKPEVDAFNGANKTWECIEKYLKMSKQRPVEMKNLVRVLRKPPFGVRCRAMPLFFAAVAHRELVFGNISFEFQRSANQIEKITSIESDTLEKVFTSPDKYKLIYVNVSSNQNALINAMAKLFAVDLTPADPSLERVKKVGSAIGMWWRALPKHAQITSQVSDAADVLREYIFRPLAELEPNTQQILLKDAFEHVFEADKKVQQKRVEEVVGPIKEEFENLLDDLNTRIVTEYDNVFGQLSDAVQGLSAWFSGLSDEKQNYIYSGEHAVLVDICRDCSEINEDILLEIAERLTGLNISSWSDDLVLIFRGKLESVKNFVDTFIPGPHPPIPDHNPDLGTGQGRLSMSLRGQNKERIFELLDDLSANGQVLENMLNSTIDQLGKGLDEKEKVAILYRVVGKHVFGA